MTTVDFNTLVELYLTPTGETIAMPSLPDSAARRLRDALEPIAIQALWSRGYFERTAAKGVSLLESYVWGRAAALGEPAPAVVVAAFGAFERGYLMGVYESGRSRLTRDEVLAAREAGAIESVTAVLGGEDPTWLADTVLEALRPLDGAARPLFSGLRELPVPADPYGRLWRAAELVREHRGDGHLAACISAGLDAPSMNILTELWTGYAFGEFSSTRSFSEQALTAALAELTDRGWVADERLTDAGTAARRAIEDATDASQSALIAGLGDRVEEVIDRAQQLSALLVSARAVPADPRKLAAG